ncbi:membrane integrity-associated transporter subunit PqiC [Erythrobacter sp. JK5]|nr:membrane integrity-associated transporter subunit PqiC [Erythrobacter sp. JK5]
MRIHCIAAALSAGLLLGGCVSFGAGDPPESLLTLKPTATAAAGAGARAGEGATIAVLTPETPAKLDVLRVPVTVSDTEIAYLQEAFWVERPARLFRRLLGETLRARGSVLVLDSDDTPTLADRTLRGTLLDMGYDAGSSAVVVRYDAVRTGEGGAVESRRFEARESGVLPDAASVGPALNRAANTVAGEVADWMTEGSIAPSAPAVADSPAG